MIADGKPLYLVPADVHTRWASGENPTGEKGQAGRANRGRKGAAWCPVDSGQRLVLAEVAGTSGMIRRIWMTLSDRSPVMLRSLRIDIHWDGALKPAVSAPLGDFFGHGLGRMVPFESRLFSSAEGRNLHCTLPMPFRTGMKVVLTNEGGTRLDQFYYDIDYTVGDVHDADALYFHAFFNRNDPTALYQDFVILPNLTGKGRYLGAHLGVRMDRERYFDAWWGEGEVKVFLDGDTDFPTLCGTGTEDYIGTAYGQGIYSNADQGCPLGDLQTGCYGFYRYHVVDPVYFHESIRVTIQQIGCADSRSKSELDQAGRIIYRTGCPETPVDLSKSGETDDYVLFERQDDWSCCSYFYLDQCESDLPELMEIALRIRNLPDAPAP